MVLNINLFFVRNNNNNDDNNNNNMTSDFVDLLHEN
jgi:hypothetical protein